MALSYVLISALRQRLAVSRSSLGYLAIWNPGETMPTSKKKPGLYANIHAKQERIAHGSGEKMRQPGEEGAPSARAFDKAEKTAKTHAPKKSAAKTRKKS